MGRVWIGIFSVALVTLCGQVWQTMTSFLPSQGVPVFERFTCTAPQCLGSHVCPEFEWRIANANVISAETGAIRHNDFVSMGVVPERVFSQADSFSFMANTSAYAMRVCAGEMDNKVCRVCDPFGG